MNAPLRPGDPGFVDVLTVAEGRVYTNDLDALEALITEGLPPDEMQAAAWVLVQRVRGLQGDLMRLQRSIVDARLTPPAVSPGHPQERKPA